MSGPGLASGAEAAGESTGVTTERVGQVSEEPHSDADQLEVRSGRKGGLGPQRLCWALNLADIGKMLKILPGSLTKSKNSS